MICWCVRKLTSQSLFSDCVSSLESKCKAEKQYYYYHYGIRKETQLGYPVLLVMLITDKKCHFMAYLLEHAARACCK